MRMPSVTQYEVTERRIGWLTLIIGVLTAAGATPLYSGRVGMGVLIGASLAWVNFRWLERAMDSVTRASTAQANSREAHVPIGGYFGLFARYALIAGIAYVIFARFHISVLSMLVGLCSLGAATILATVWEVLSTASRRED